MDHSSLIGKFRSQSDSVMQHFARFSFLHIYTYIKRKKTLSFATSQATHERINSISVQKMNSN